MSKTKFFNYMKCFSNYANRMRWYVNTTEKKNNMKDLSMWYNGCYNLERFHAPLTTRIINKTLGYKSKISD